MSCAAMPARNAVGTFGRVASRVNCVWPNGQWSLGTYSAFLIKRTIRALTLYSAEPT